ncbi:MAG: hypothetical protein H0V96_02960 [Acidimicrobiia bacterium]|nr:hypothetical protein [Acidimicrobiia bacterium]
MIPHHHDPDVIMALADGTLTGDAGATAAAEIAACPRCAADLDAQRRAGDALAGLAVAADARITELESMRLHRAIRQQLGHPTAVPVRQRRTVAAPNRRRLNWAPLTTAAAVFLALVVGGTVIRSFSGGDDAADGVPEAAATFAGDAAEDSDGQRNTAASPASGTSSQPETFQLNEASTTPAASGDTSGDAEAVAMSIADLTELADQVEADLVDQLGLTGVDTESLLASSLDEIGSDADAFGEVSSEQDCMGTASVYLGEPVESVVLGSIEIEDLGTAVVTVNAATDGTVRILLHDPVACTVIEEVP